MGHGADSRGGQQCSRDITMIIHSVACSEGGGAFFSPGETAPFMSTAFKMMKIEK